MRQELLGDFPSLNRCVEESFRLLRLELRELRAKRLVLLSERLLLLIEVLYASRDISLGGGVGERWTTLTDVID